MKNIIKIASSALAIMLVMTSVAFAAPTSGSNGSSTGSSNSAPTSGSNGNSAGSNSSSAPSNGSNGNSAGSTGSAPSNGSNGNSAGEGSGTDNGSGSNGGSKSRRSSGGGSSYTRVNITDVKVSVVGNVATITWKSNPLSLGRIIYGSASIATPTNVNENHGYAFGTKFGNLQDSHSISFVMEAGKTYFVRPVSAIGTRVFFGSELKVSTSMKNNSTVSAPKTAKPAIGIDSGSTIKIDTVIPADVEISFSTSTSNTAAAGSSKIGSFFKKIWNSITSPFCR